MAFSLLVELAVVIPTDASLGAAQLSHGRVW
jgi:hypothetical protein